MPVEPSRRRAFDRFMLKWLSFAPRMLAVLLALGVPIALLIRFESKDILKFLDIRDVPSGLQITFFVIAFIAIGIFFSFALEGGGGGVLRNMLLGGAGVPYRRALERLSREIADTRGALRDLQVEQTPLLTDQDKQALLDSLRASIRATGGREVLEEIRAKVETNATLDSIHTSSNVTLERLRIEKTRVARRGNFNLFVGLVTTIAGVWLLLGYARELSMGAESTLLPTAAQTSAPRLSPLAASQGSQAKSVAAIPNATSYILLFLPRLSLVLLIEVFAYFFLGLYKASLLEVKYIQNEMTTVELRALALKAAIAVDDRDSTKEVLRAYSIVDRNLHAATTESQRVTATEAAKLIESVNQLLSTVAKR